MTRVPIVVFPGARFKHDTDFGLIISKEDDCRQIGQRTNSPEDEGYRCVH